MSAVIRKVECSERWVGVSVGDGDFELLVRHPTYKQLLSDYGDPAEMFRKRIEAVVAGWRGVLNVDGTPVTFSLESLWAWCEACPSLVDQLITIAASEYSSMREDERKNFDTPPVTGSPPEATAKESETNSTCGGV